MAQVERWALRCKHSLQQGIRLGAAVLRIHCEGDFGFMGYRAASVRFFIGPTLPHNGHDQMENMRAFREAGSVFWWCPANQVAVVSPVDWLESCDR